MKTKTLLFVLCATASSAWAEPDPKLEQARAAAVQTEREAGTRVGYYAQLTTIAERDIVTAQITIDTSRKQWDQALRANDAESAGYWAKRHATARADEDNAHERANRFRAARDNARQAFEASAAEVRKLRDRG